MLEHLPCVHIDPAPFRPQPIRSNMDKRAIRFELERQACQSLRQVLQLKLQQRRSREELVSQGIMPPLKGSAAFHEQRRSLERARTEDYLKRKIRSRPEKSELIRMHILEEPSAEPFLQAKQLQLKRVRLADDLNDRIAHRPGPMELIHKNILPVHSSIKQAFIETQFPRASGENSSFDEDSNDSLSPEQPRPVSECSLGLGPLPSPRETLIGRGIPSPTQVPPPAPSLLSTSGSAISIKLTNETAVSSVLRTGANSHIKPQPKPTCDRSALRHKKAKDKPKIKKLKYHQYIPPDQKGDKEPPPHLDSSYAKILQQQQLFLQLQILSQQQQHYHTILPAPARSQTAQQPSSSSKSMSTSSPARPAAAPSTDFSNQCIHTCLSSVPVSGTKPVSLPLNLDEMKVAELKSELKLRSLPVSGTKSDLIERLRTYQELNGGSDTTSTPTAGGTTGPGAERAGKSSKNTAIIVTGSSATLIAATPQQFRTCGGSLATSAVSLTPSCTSPAAMSPEDTSLNSDPLRDLMSSPLTQLSLQPSSAAQLLTHIKEEPQCLTPAPCQHSAKSASLQRCCSVSSDAPTTTSTAPVVSIDKDRLLQEKDKQIEELTRMLWQKQRLVEVLKMQLENGDRGKVPEPISVLGVKEEPLDDPDVALSTGSAQLPFNSTSLSQEMDVAKVIVKQEVIEAEEVEPEKTLQTPVPHGFLQPLTQMQEEQVAQQHTIQKVLVQQQQQQHNIQKQQHTIQNQNQMLENHNLQKPCQQRKKKSQKLQLMQKQLLQSQQQQQQSKHVQQMQLKQQLLLKQQKSVLQQQMKQQQTKQLQQIQIQTKIQLKQQQVLIQQKQQVQKQQQSAKVPQAHLKQQSGSGASFSLDHLKIDSTPTLVTDGNGNHFLIALSNHLTGNQITNPSEGKATNRITLQRLQSTPAKLADQDPVQQTRAESKAKQSMQVKFLKQHARNGVLQVTVEKPQQGTAQCLSAPPSLQPFFRDQETAPSGKTTSSSSSNNEICPNLEVLFSPVSPASVKTAASLHDEKDTDREDDFIDIILQKGETSFKTAPDPSLDCLHPDSSASSPPPSPLHVLLSPPIPPSFDTPHLAPSLKPELRGLADTTEQKQHFGHAGSGRLEDFLESTTGKPLLGVEPGGLLTLIDDLHNQMLCTSSILDHPPSPMDTVAPWEQGLDNMDWLDLTTEGDREAETPSLALQTPPSVFSTDFLDSSDLHIQWESCL